MSEQEDVACSMCGGLSFVREGVPFGHPHFGQLFPCRCKLVLDDLGTESASPWVQEKLYQLFNHRPAPGPGGCAFAYPAAGHGQYTGSGAKVDGEHCTL